MKRAHRVVLAIDASINLLLGLILVLAPAGTIRILGLPDAGTCFYTTVLGSVLVGIGIALLLSLKSLAGLGLLGAIAINLCGAVAVAVWLVLTPSRVSDHGRVVLWSLVVAVLGIAIAELLARPWRQSGTGESQRQKIRGTYL